MIGMYTMFCLVRRLKSKSGVLIVVEGYCCLDGLRRIDGQELVCEGSSLKK